VIPRYFYRILATFERFTSKGIKIIYVMGNHDFGHRDFFLTELNIDIVKTDLSIEIENKKIYLSHGDEKIYNGREYSFLKKILRNNICQKLFCSIHPDIGIPIARASSRKSRKVQSNRSGNDSRYDCLKHFAEEKLLEGYDYVIMGHSHRSLVHTIEKPGGSFGTYINLGSWLDEIQYVFFDGTDFRLQRGGEAPAGN
jgi:UDP-2,3-diacylglucosamine hydrolase